MLFNKGANTSYNNLKKKNIKNPIVKKYLYLSFCKEFPDLSFLNRLIKYNMEVPQDTDLVLWA